MQKYAIIHLKIYLISLIDNFLLQSGYQESANRQLTNIFVTRFDGNLSVLKQTYKHGEECFFSSAKTQLLFIFLINTILWELQIL
ncbi:hypothetical protein BGC07_06090 [Piscirickettsia litoralis]|uniref:Uncharacterized protein n=1 Tax=Piscirickettsia litoralis TaxID=1891921 RepID=A0ABX3A142_9GAMM|nr:hypothetical protein BGC07_06090 [Piscirickettsia litoralis]